MFSFELIPCTYHSHEMSTGTIYTDLEEKSLTMRLLRERTKIAPRKEITEAHLDTKWTLPEKKKLLVALRK